jgi:hypothetical protein
MTIKELANFVQTSIKIKDAHDGKVLCFRYKSDKHSYLADRRILAIWAEIGVNDVGYDSFARPVICVYVEHEEVQHE